MRYVNPDGKLVFLAIPAAIGVKAFVAWTLSLAVCGAAGYAIGKSTQDIINYSKEQAQNSNNVSDSLKQNAQTPASAAGSPSPNENNNKDNDDNKDSYESNPKHHQNAKGNVGREPENAKAMFDKSVKDSKGRRWYKDKNGKLHRFEKHDGNKYHWNGSYEGKASQMPSHVQKLYRNLSIGEI